MEFMTSEKNHPVTSSAEHLDTRKDRSYADAETKPVSTHSNKFKMLSIKECLELVDGLSENTLRKLLKQKKVKSIRAGEGKRGKYLVNQDSLLECMGYIGK